MTVRRYYVGIDVDGNRYWSERARSLEMAYLFATETRELVRAEILLGEEVMGNDGTTAIRILNRWAKSARRNNDLREDQKD